MSELATAYANLGKAYLDLADAVDTAPTRPQDAPGATRGGNVTSTTYAETQTTTAPAFDDLAPDEYDQKYVEGGDPWDPPQKPAGHAAVCPAHDIPYRSGRYGSYCPSTSDDPKWSNEKGYCTVTPKNAAAWLRQHA